MGLRVVSHFLFALYCTLAGVLLFLLPWSAAWNHILSQLTPNVAEWLDRGVLRGAVSGFGLVHLVWSVHDLALVLRASLGIEDDA